MQATITSTITQLAPGKGLGSVNKGARIPRRAEKEEARIARWETGR
jgi:hypothetical protein